MAYLIFENLTDAQKRSEDAGKAKNLSYHQPHSGKTGSRYWWAVTEEATEENPRAYIEIAKHTFTNEDDEEEVYITEANLLTDDEIQFLEDELPEDWQHPSTEQPIPIENTDDEDSDDEDDEEPVAPPRAD